MEKLWEKGILCATAKCHDKARWRAQDIRHLSLVRTQMSWRTETGVRAEQKQSGLLFGSYGAREWRLIRVATPGPGSHQFCQQAHSQKTPTNYSGHGILDTCERS